MSIPPSFRRKRSFTATCKATENHLTADDRIVVMGDMNISSTDLDIGIGEDSRKRWLRTGKCSFLPEEREWMARLLSWGLVDTARSESRLRRSFLWFDYRSRGFDDNRGLRIDLLLATRVWRSAAWRPALIMIFALWKNRPTTRRFGLNSACKKRRCDAGRNACAYFTIRQIKLLVPRDFSSRTHCSSTSSALTTAPSE